MRRKIETYTAATLAALALLISILDMVGAFERVSWLRENVSKFTLLAVGAILLHLVITDWSAPRELRDALKESTNEIRDAVRGVKLHEFEDAAQYFRYAVDAIDKARHSIVDVTWGQPWDPEISADTQRAYGQYRAAVARACKRGSRSNVVYREIMSFPDGKRIGRVKDMLKEEYPNYHVRYFDYPHEGTPPLLQFFVLDRREALVSVLSNTAFQNRYFAVASGGIAAALHDYFELAWRDAEILKDPSGIQAEVLNQLESRYRL